MPGFTACSILVFAGTLAGSLLPGRAAAQTAAVGHAATGPTFGDDYLYRFGLNVVGGAERRNGQFGVGADLAVLYFPATRRSAGLGEVSGSEFFWPLASAYGAYHFGQTGRGLEPFAQAGVAVSFAGGVGWDLGGGADWWLTPRVGVRTAIRDRFARLPLLGPVSVEGGIVFR